MKDRSPRSLLALLLIVTTGIAHAHVNVNGASRTMHQAAAEFHATATNAADVPAVTPEAEAAMGTAAATAGAATAAQFHATAANAADIPAVTLEAQAGTTTAAATVASDAQPQTTPAAEATTATVVTPDAQAAIPAADTTTTTTAAVNPDVQAATAAADTTTTTTAAATPDVQAATATADTTTTTTAAVTADAQVPAAAADTATTTTAAVTADAQVAAAAADTTTTTTAAVTADAQVPAAAADTTTTTTAAVTADAQVPAAAADTATTTTAAVTADAQVAAAAADTTTTTTAAVTADAQVPAAAADTTTTTTAAVTPDAQVAAAAADTTTTTAAVTPDVQAETPAADTTTTTSAATTPDAQATTGTGGSEVATAGGEANPADSSQQPQQEQQPAINPIVSQVVDFAPAATVKDGDDITRDGACKAEVGGSCAAVEQGAGRLAECVGGLIAESESGTEGAPSVSAECRESVFQFKIERNTNINHNAPLARACKEDAEMFCNVTWFFGYRAGQVLSCLKDVKAQVSKPCKQELFKIMMDAATDFRSDPVLYEACKEDSESLCQGVDNGGGRIQGCLRDKRMQLSWACEEQLFKQEMEDADDIRLSVRLFAKCMLDKRKFCKEVESGNSRTKECLEEHREELSEGCKQEIDAMIERRVHDFRLDPPLREACEEDIFKMCAYYNNLEEIDAYDSSVVNCLQDFSAEIVNPKCKEQVHKYVALAAQDIRFDVPLAEACFDDRQKFCAHVPAGSARVTRCLSNKRSQLTPVCRATLFDEEVRFSENIDFQAPMKAACEAEIRLFCKRVPHENGRVIRCLQENKGEKNFGQPCREEVESYEVEIGRDYRLNYRLRTACQQDIQDQCPSLCADTAGQVCGGKVLRCLSEKSEELKAEACRKEVAYFVKMEVSDFRNDILLAEACRDDVEQHCNDVQPGEGRVHKCLRDNIIKISKNCRKEELLLEEKEASSIELSPNLMRCCKAERLLFCKAVAAGSARVFRCLAENVNAGDFGALCRTQVVAKLRRRQINWRLDPPLRKACRADVGMLCSAEEQSTSVDGSVYKCMVRRFSELSSSCQRELGRAMHMALFVYQPSALLTSDCDDDIARRCVRQNPGLNKQPGAVAKCLANIVQNEPSGPRAVTSNPVSAPAISNSRRLLVEEDKAVVEVANDAAQVAEPAVEPAAAQDASTKGVVSDAEAPLSPLCYALADIAEPPDARRSFESSLSLAALLQQLDRLGSSAGLALTVRNRLGAPRGVSLTGWLAMAGIAALVLLLMFGAVLAYRRLRGMPAAAHVGYTMVVKAEPK